ncbi:coniferyl aldehyde dehydrogenase [Rhodobacteraceae bacterium RKSG542]|nr:coniferyl aldehyde dehydrogenase [Pseudovibrio flavus]
MQSDTLVAEEAVQAAPSVADILKLQREAFLRDQYPSFEERRERLLTLKNALTENREAFKKALDEDFNGRAYTETEIAEFYPILEGIKYQLKHLKRWMKPSKRHVSMMMQPAKARVIYQPLGTVGILVPFNYPLMLSIGPLMTALAAGNRAAVKMSEFTPATSRLLAEVLGKAFPKDLVCVVEGDAQVATEFSSQPWDHLVFTGSTAVGRHVMRAAADNLTPVTLELGGKSPTIIDRDFPLEEAADRICFGKSLNAGQTCIAPDYVLVPREKRDAFVSAYLAAFERMYPRWQENKDYSSIINDRHFARLNGLLKSAGEQGAQAHSVPDANVEAGRKLAPHVLTEVTDDMAVMQEEIFGPLLPVIAYDELEDALEFVRARARPLALYYFSNDKAKQEHVLHQTHSGGVSINDCVMHVAIDDLPFGGIGPSGMGHYHGPEGFKTLSKAKSVLSKGGFNSTKFIYPPYTTALKRFVLKTLLGR